MKTQGRAPRGRMAAVMVVAWAAGAAAGPDITVSSMANNISKYNNQGPIAAYSFTTVSCNIGDADAIWIDCNSGNDCNQHPVIAQNIYRLKDGRFEQIGLGWLKHGFCALDEDSCPVGTIVPNPSCDWLGIYAADTYSAQLNGSQAGMGPRSEVNPWTGEYPYPFTLGWGQTGNSIFKRCQVHNDDVNPNLNAGALYFGEAQYVCTDELPADRLNNVTWKQFVVGSPSGGGWAFGSTGGPRWQQPAIQAWQEHDAGVVLVNVDSLDALGNPVEGRFVLGCKVTDNLDGTWDYEYALYNQNNSRGARLFSVPVDDAAAVTNVGFHDVTYHSGEPFEGTDWATERAGGLHVWQTQTFAENPNANALRWGTLYNFRFTADRPPTTGEVTIGLFAPAEGAPDLLVASIQVPAAPPVDCAGDLDGDSDTDSTDLNLLLSAFGCSGGGCTGDLDGDGDTDSTDLNLLLSDFGCG